MADVLIGEAVSLGLIQNILVKRIGGNKFFNFRNVGNFFKEEQIYLGGVYNSVKSRAFADKGGNGVNSVVGAYCDIVKEIFFAHPVKLRVIDMALACFQRANRL